jgi:hypothetical protein
LDLIKMGFVVSCTTGMEARVLFGTFSCLRIERWGQELMGSTGKTIMLSGGNFCTFMAIRMHK